MAPLSDGALTTFLPARNRPSRDRSTSNVPAPARSAARPLGETDPPASAAACRVILLRGLARCHHMTLPTPTRPR
jgi:hypothetical protein